jgi:hypothetical protein
MTKTGKNAVMTWPLINRSTEDIIKGMRPGPGMMPASDKMPASTIPCMKLYTATATHIRADTIIVLSYPSLPRLQQMIYLSEYEGTPEK